MSPSMRALVLVGPERLEVRDVPRPVPRSGEVLVRPEAVGLCGTDFHIFQGAANYNLDPSGRPVPLYVEPQILGHEVTGVVEEVGAGVDDLRQGERVVLDQGVNCSSVSREPWCEYCASGASHQCEHYREHGISGLPGGLAEAIVVPARNAIAIRSDLEPAVAALTEPLACVLHATEVLLEARTRYLLETSDAERRARTVLVCGAGPAGLLWVQVLRRVARYPGRILVSEPDPRKRALAAELGGTPIDPTRGDLAEEVRRSTDGRRAEVLIDASGAGRLFLEVPGLVRKQATLVLYGHGHAGVGMEALNRVQWGEPSLLSPVGASGGFDEDGRPTVYREALRLLEEGRVEVGPLLTHRARGLEAVPEVFRSGHRAGGYVKGVALL